MESLAALFEVEVWHPDLGDPHETTVPCVPFPAREGADLRALERYDHVVYNLGNNYDFHGGIWFTAERRPGIIILHDAVMYHFFAELYLGDKSDPKTFVEIFDTLYGPEAARRVNLSLRGLESSISETAEICDWSLLEAAVDPALGIVVHSEYCRAKVEGIVECPVVKAELPVERLVGRRVLDRHRIGVPGDHLLVVVAGGLNRNKRVDSVIRALGALRGGLERTTLALVGGVTDEEAKRLKGIAESEGVERSLVFTGFVSDDEFYSYLSHADICVNLRYPNTEGASASVIEEMLFDNAVIVLDTGVFRELPDYAVRRVRLAYEHEDLVRALGELSRSPGRRKELATRARIYAEGAYRVERYVRKIREVLAASAVSAPLLCLADEVSGILSQIGCSRGSDTVERVACCIDETFLRTWE